MDIVTIKRKLDSLQRCLQRIIDKCPETVEPLINDVDLQDVLILNLTRAVQLSVDLAAHILASQRLPPPETMGQSFDRLANAGLISPDLALRLRKAVGFRNIAIHAYDAIDWSIVHAISTRSLDDFRALAKVVQAQLHTTSM